MNHKDLKPVRKIKSGQMTVSKIEIGSPGADWLLAQAGKNDDWQLLAFADDGLIWGKIEQGALTLSGKVFPEFSPPLRAETLQEVRLFNQTAQIYAWRSDNGWQARRISDKTGNSVEYYDEAQILWGNTWQDQQNGFTRVSEGALGFWHAVPLAVAKSKFNNEQRPLRLTVRHYLSKNEETGALVVTLSRLVKIAEVQ